MNIVYPKDETYLLISQKFNEICNKFDKEDHKKCLSLKKKIEIAKKIDVLGLIIMLVAIALVPIPQIKNIDSPMFNNGIILIATSGLAMFGFSFAYVINRESYLASIYKNQKEPFIISNYDSRIVFYNDLVDMLKELKENNIKDIVLIKSKEPLGLGDDSDDDDEELDDLRNGEYFEYTFQVRDEGKHGEYSYWVSDDIFEETTDFSYLDKLTEEKLDAIIKEDMELDKGQAKQ